MSAWQPKARIENLRIRAQLLARIRDFFAQRNILEVETPLLGRGATTDIYIHSFTTVYHPPGVQENSQLFYLQTSPEFAMKRLLAANSGAIYQICKAFRNGEFGRKHNSEFTMLEWYRPGFNHHQLMDEMDEFLQYILNTSSAQRFSYVAMFQHYLNLHPYASSVFDLKNCAKEQGLGEVAGIDDDKNTWLDLLLTHFIEPHLGKNAPVFIYDFPASQASLAKIRQDDFPVAERFEVYMQGMELANGFHELSDAKEQEQRFIADNLQRKKLGLAEITIDHYLIQALENDFPECAGVALGIDRLMMLALQTESIEQVLSFTLENA